MSYAKHILLLVQYIGGNNKNNSISLADLELERLWEV